MPNIRGEKNQLRENLRILLNCNHQAKDSFQLQNHHIRYWHPIPTITITPLVKKVTMNNSKKNDHLIIRIPLSKLRERPKNSSDGESTKHTQDITRTVKDREENQINHVSEYNCSFCNKKYETEERLNNHKKDNHILIRIPIFALDERHETDSNGYERSKRKRKRTKCLDKVKCPICKEKLAMEDRLSQHIKESHMTICVLYEDQENLRKKKKRNQRARHKRHIRVNKKDKTQ